MPLCQTSIFTRIISAYAKKILYAPWAFHPLADELYDVGITYIAMLRRSVELCSAGRLLHFSQKNFQKRSVKRARDRSETVVLTEREKTTYSPTERVIAMANIPRQSVPYRFDAFCKKVLRHYDRYIKKLCTRKLSCFAERTGKAFWGHAICH